MPFPISLTQNLDVSCVPRCDCDPFEFFYFYKFAVDFHDLLVCIWLEPEDKCYRFATVLPIGGTFLWIGGLEAGSDMDSSVSFS